MQKAVLLTEFASTVNTANVLNEYPQPEMVREKWIYLNGIWQFQPCVNLSEALLIGKLTSKILVPFPVETAISGIMKQYDKLLYRRMFTLSVNWAGKRY